MPCAGRTALLPEAARDSPVRQLERSVQGSVLFMISINHLD